MQGGQFPTGNVKAVQFLQVSRMEHGSMVNGRSENTVGFTFTLTKLLTVFIVVRTRLPKADGRLPSAQRP